MKTIIFGASLSGKSLARHFFKEKTEAFLYDDKPIKKENLLFFHKKNIQALSKKKFLSFIKKETCQIILSPGVPLSHPLVCAAKQNKRPVLSETEYALSKLRAPVIAITGTNGKSTVASMCHHILSNSGYKTTLVGNIGTPVTELLMKKESWDFLVLELSSYQLEQMIKIDFFRSVFLNFSQDHLERHKTLRNYFKAKWKIFESSARNALGFCPPEIEEQAKIFGFTKRKKIPLKASLSRYYAQFVPENLKNIKHNKENAMTSLKVCSSVSKQSTRALSKSLLSFKTIPHRFENFAQQGKLIFIDDSKATNVHATLSALSSSQNKVLLLLGGRLKEGEDLSQVLSYQNKIQKVLSFGEASDRIKTSLQTSLSVKSFKSLRSLLKNLASILKQEKETQSVLFSPACSSFDEFKNFSDRGQFFQKEVKKLLTKKETASEKRKKKT